MPIHEQALVDTAAELAADVEVGPYAVIGPRVRIGPGCRIGPHTVLHPGVTLAAGCRVHAHAVLGDLPQDLAFEESTESFVEIGEGTVIREGVTIHRGTKPGTVTTVGAGCLLMVNCHLAHNVRLGDRVILANGALLAGYVEVGDRAFLSGNAVVHQFTRIGRLAMLSGGAAVSKDVPPFCVVPAATVNAVAGLNVIGMRRAGLGTEDRRAVQQAFRLLYRSGLNVRQAVERLADGCPSGPASEFAEFIAASRRGICAWTGRAADAGAPGED